MMIGTGVRRDFQTNYRQPNLRRALFLLLWAVAATETTHTIGGRDSGGLTGGYNSVPNTATASQPPRIITIKRSRALDWPGVGTPPPPSIDVPRPPLTPPWRFMPGAAPAQAPLWPHVLRALQLSRNRGDNKRWQVPSSGSGGNYRQSTSFNSRIDHRPTSRSEVRASIGASTHTVSTTETLANHKSPATRRTSTTTTTDSLPRQTTKGVVDVTAVTKPPSQQRYNQPLQRRTSINRQRSNHLLARQGHYGINHRRQPLDRRVFQTPQQTVSNRNWRKQKKKSFMSNIISRIFGGAAKINRKKQPVYVNKMGGAKNIRYKMYQSKPSHLQTAPQINPERSNIYQAMNQSPYRKKKTEKYKDQHTAEKQHEKQKSVAHTEKTVESKAKLDPPHERPKESNAIPLEFELEDAKDWESKRIKLDDFGKSVTTDKIPNQQITRKTSPAKLPRMTNDHTERPRPIYKTNVETPRVANQQHQDLFGTGTNSYGQRVWPSQNIRQKSDGTLVVTGTLLDPTTTTSTRDRSPSRSQRSQQSGASGITANTEHNLGTVSRQPHIVSATSDYNVFNNHLLLKRRRLETKEPYPVVANIWQPAQHLAITLHQLIAKSRDQ